MAPLRRGSLTNVEASCIQCTIIPLLDRQVRRFTLDVRTFVKAEDEGFLKTLADIQKIVAANANVSPAAYHP